MEAAQLDGANLFTILRKVILPVATPGIAATALICFIFSWNDLLFARVLTGTAATTAPVFLTGFVSSQGLFLARSEERRVGKECRSGGAPVDGTESRGGESHDWR